MPSPDTSVQTWKVTSQIPSCSECSPQLSACSRSPSAFELKVCSSGEGLQPVSGNSSRLGQREDPEASRRWRFCHGSGTAGDTVEQGPQTSVPGSCTSLCRALTPEPECDCVWRHGLSRGEVGRGSRWALFHAKEMQTPQGKACEDAGAGQPPSSHDRGLRGSHTAGPWASGSAPRCEEVCLCSGPACGGGLVAPAVSHQPHQ